MGYLKTTDNDALPLPSAPEFVVYMKRRATWGDTSAAQAAMIHEGMVSSAKRSQASNGATPDEATQVAEVISEAETDAYMQMLVARLIVSWNLTDEQDNVLPINRETVALLEPEDGEFLAGEAQKRRGGRPAAQQRPFSKPSSRRSMGIKSSTQKPAG